MQVQLGRRGDIPSNSKDSFLTPKEGLAFPSPLCPPGNFSFCG
jgi:hypothetical protein